MLRNMKGIEIIKCSEIIEYFSDCFTEEFVEGCIKIIRSLNPNMKTNWEIFANIWEEMLDVINIKTNWMNWIWISI